MTLRKALVGFHSELGANIADLFRKRGYEVTEVGTAGRMIEEISRGNESYEFYVIDANLGDPNEDTCEPAGRAYSLVKDKVEKGLVKFMLFVGNAQAKKMAERQGIPVISKSDINGQIEFYGTIESID